MLISRKDRGGLIKPSEDVVKLCSIAERIFKQNTIFSGNVMKRLIYSAKKDLNTKLIFRSLDDHILDQDPINNHLLQLINLIYKLYFTIRIHHHNSTLNETKDRIRHKYSKLILFKNQ